MLYDNGGYADGVDDVDDYENDGDDGDDDDDDADGGLIGNCSVCEGDDEKTCEQEINYFDSGDYQHSTKADENDSYDPIECFLL